MVLKIILSISTPLRCAQYDVTLSVPKAYLRCNEPDFISGEWSRRVCSRFCRALL